MSWKGISRALRPCRASWPGGKATPASDENVLQEPHFQSAKKLKQTRFPSAMSLKRFETSGYYYTGTFVVAKAKGCTLPDWLLQNQMCRYQRSVMFTCLLGSSAFIAIQHDPNLLYNTVSFNLCVCFVWPWIQIDWNGRSQWMQSFWELTTQIWVWFILGAGHQPFWIVTNLWQYFSTFLNCVWQYRKSVFLSFLSIMFFSGCSGWSTCSNVLEAQT